MQGHSCNLNFCQTVKKMTKNNLEIGGWSNEIFSVMFRRAPGKFATSFVEKNFKLVGKCGFKFQGRTSEQAEKKPQFL